MLQRYYFFFETQKELCDQFFDCYWRVATDYRRTHYNESAFSSIQYPLEVDSHLGVLQERIDCVFVTNETYFIG